MWNQRNLQSHRKVVLRKPVGIIFGSHAFQQKLNKISLLAFDGILRSLLATLSNEPSLAVSELVAIVSRVEINADN